MAIANFWGAAELGFWFEVNDLSTLKVERTGAAATTQAVVGGPVGTILDKSGNANHAVAFSDAERGTLGQDANGNYYVIGNGTNTNYRLTNAPFMYPSGSGSFFAAVHNPTPGTYDTLYGEGNSADNGITYSVQSDSTTGTQLEPYIRSAAATIQIPRDNLGVTVSPGPLVFGMTDTGAAVTGWNGAVAATTHDYNVARDPAAVFDTSTLMGYRRTSVIDFWNGRLYGAIGVSRVLTQSEITEADTYLAGLYAATPINSGTLGVTDGADAAAIAGGPVTISGTTRDAQGAPLGGVTVRAFLTADNTLQASTTSNGSGVFSMDVPTTGAHYLVAYLEGAPDVAGMSRNDIIPGGGGA